MPRSEFAPIVDSLVDGLAVIDGVGTITRVNPALCTMFGYPDCDLVGQNVSVLMNADVAAEHTGYLERYLETGEGNVIGVGREVVGRHSDGHPIDLELSVTPAELNGQTMFVGFLRDISERKEAEKLYHLNNRVMRAVNRALVNVINEGMSTREVFDGALEDLLDVTESEYGFIGEILHDEDLPYLKTHAITNIAWNKETRDFYRENVRAGLEFRNLNTLFGVTIRSGQMVITNDPGDDPRRGGLPKGHPPLETYLGVPIYSGPKLLGMAGVANRKGGYDEDLVDQIKPLLSAFGTLIAAHQNHESRIKAEEELFRTQQQLKQMATKDPITDIANRYMLVQELEVAYERCRSGEDFSVLFIDLDHFKLINDRHGHDLGDKVLKHVAQQLEAALRPSDIVGRYGGEEFIVGLPNCSPDNARMIAERMRDALNATPFVAHEAQEIELSMSIGIAAISQQPGSLEELIKFADRAMYVAKEQGRNRVVPFSAAS
jgi:diguanylate cyclase (GGDEF)-like protein/PAS domain S-box-containing protein